MVLVQIIAFFSPHLLLLLVVGVYLLAGPLVRHKIFLYVFGCLSFAIIIFFPGLVYSLFEISPDLSGLTSMVVYLSTYLAINALAVNAFVKRFNWKYY